MERVAVESSALREIGYEDGVLEVRFATGRVYRYLGVPEHLYAELLRAESRGRFFNENVRDAYRFVRA
jgi:hypothetical protein